MEALKGQQSAASGQPGDDAGLASLTAEDKYVCAQLGMTEADYLKAKEAK
ncbi:phage protease [Desulfovibrio sp. 1188_IL3213]